MNGLSHHALPYLDEQDATKLNKVDVWLPDSTSSTSTGDQLWVIYIHGGAWRDPEVDSKSFLPAIKSLWDSSSRDQIAGFASINYRLSPYPEHPTDPSTTDDASRNAHHPDHLLDVAHALVCLQDRYQISGRYVLVGHSAGATLAFQLDQSLLHGEVLPKPAAVLGVAGIYSFNHFVDSHSEIPIYEHLIKNAFPERNDWIKASPYSSESTLATLWRDTTAIVISRSKDDELVEEGQATLMLERLRLSSAAAAKLHFLEVTGAHDDIWNSGATLASLVIQTLAFVSKAAKGH